MGSAHRDNFTSVVKKELAFRVGFRCSMCNCMTVAPKDGTRGYVIIGEAAHITSASQGGPRFDSSISTSARTDATNGIWLCSNCHIKVDSDPDSYPPERLLEIKKQAEARAKGEYSRKNNQTDNLLQNHNHNMIMDYEISVISSNNVFSDNQTFEPYNFSISEPRKVTLQKLLHTYASSQVEDLEHHLAEDLLCDLIFSKLGKDFSRNDIKSLLQTYAKLPPHSTLSKQIESILI
jgi:hypothetical protein